MIVEGAKLRDNEELIAREALDAFTKSLFRAGAE
jgi:hypothetical protein